ncbi:MAG: hypothetical protein Mars2KO_44500 [Maribacter sp.]
MYYLLIKKLGRWKCVSKNSSNSFGDTYCSNDFSYPSNVSKINELRFRCLESGQQQNGRICADYHTARSIIPMGENLITIRNLDF